MMIPGLAVAAITAALLIWIVLPPLLRRRRRARLAAQPLDADRRRLLAASVPLYAGMPDALRGRLQAQVQLFLDEKRFVGCGGLEVSAAMRMAVAAHACLLCLRDNAECFPAVREILLYPDAFWVRRDAPDDLGLISEEHNLLAGEAWDIGRVVLSWAAVAEAQAGADHNVVVHEFAHQLDYEAPASPGAPVLADYGDWARVFTDAFAQLRSAGSPVIDMYGAESPVEFFAVVTEAYFQRGAALAAQHPALYDLLRDYYVLDTAACD